MSRERGVGRQRKRRRKGMEEDNRYGTYNRIQMAHLKILTGRMQSLSSRNQWERCNLRALT